MGARNVLIGNGINVNYGGNDYTNGKIIERLMDNLSNVARYESVFKGTVSAEELLGLVKGLNDIFNKMIKESIFSLRRTETEDEMRSLIDISRRYKGKSFELLEVGMEDYFFVMKWFNNGYSDGAELSKCVFDGLKWLFLDSIYNDGKIEELYKEMTPFAKELSRFNKIFTVNYDTNLDKLTSNTVYHLHGSFSKLDDTYRPETIIGLLASQKDNPPQIVRGKEHMYCNAIMGYSGEYKYKQMDNYRFINSKLTDKTKAAHEYPIEEFRSIEGELHIIGMSPSNDNHITNMINSNPNISSVIFYCIDTEAFTEAKRVIKKPLQMRNVLKYWKSL